MRIFALETDANKIKDRYCHDGEVVVFMTYYHGLSFMFAIMREIFITLALLAIAIAGYEYHWPMNWILPVIIFVWLLFVVLNVMKAYIDWFFDFIMVTTDKIILLDQSSIFKQVVKPIHVENIGGISTATQFWNIFPFGQLTIHLKEGLGGDKITLKFIPRVQDVAGAISEVVTRYQRFRSTRTPPPSEELTTKGDDLGSVENAQ